MSQNPVDVFTDSPIVVDGTLLEASKENIRPIASGRRATALAGILATPHAQRESMLASSHRRFRMTIANALAEEEDDDGQDYEAQADDALGAYSEYVSWTIEHYPEGHVSLVPLLEEATRTLKDMRGGVYRQDPRYLKLWSSYADLVERPEVIWRFLFTNDIGTARATLYESFAHSLERVNRKQEADEIFLVGIARSAQPLERLQAKHKDFQKRMMASFMAPTVDVTESTATAAPTAPKRRALGEKKIKSGSTSIPTPAPAPVPTPSTSTSNGQIPVFVDEAPLADPRTSIALLSGGSAEGPARNAWPELGTRTSRIKENKPDVGKLAGTTLKQKRPAAARPAASGSRSAFTVFSGPEEPEEKVAAKSKPSSSSKSGKPTATKLGKIAKPAKSPAPEVQVDTEDEDAEPMESKMLPAEQFVPFVDEEENEPAPKAAFMPFTDDIPGDGSPVRPSSKVPPSVTKRGLSTPGVSRASSLAEVENAAAASEAEALRKDPLKNYS